MHTDWHAIDRWLLGEAWAGSAISRHLDTLCNAIGPRWASSAGEAEAVAYINGQMQEAGLQHVAAEEYPLQTWRLESHAANLGGAAAPVAILPFNRCPACDIRGPLVDVGYGIPADLDAAGDGLHGAIAVMNLGAAPFAEPVLLPYRLTALARAGAAAAVVVDRKEGGRVEYHNAGDWRDMTPDSHPLPTVAVSREEGARLRRAAAGGDSLHLRVAAELYEATGYNTSAQLTGAQWPDACIVLGGHHDTVYGSPGANDNGSGVSVVLETARVLALAQRELKIAPGCGLRFATFSAEEQNLQGATAYAARHFGEGARDAFPRLAINLDELATGPIKGMVLGFPPLRPLIQQQFDAMGDGLQCHVMSQLDTSSDHFPFLRAGIDAAHLWRWRFTGRRPDSDFHHEPGDTVDKVDVRQLKEYVGQLARLILRLSLVSPEDWPQNPVTEQEVARRLEAERGQLVRVF